MLDRALEKSGTRVSERYSVQLLVRDCVIHMIHTVWNMFSLICMLNGSAPGAYLLACLCFVCLSQKGGERDDYYYR